MKKYSIISAIFFSLLFVGCSEDYLETSPTGSISEADMLSGLAGAETVINGIHRATYQYYGAHDKYGQKSIDYALSCLGDDFYPVERGYGWFVAWYQWLEHRNAQSGNLEYVWSYYYDLINNANLVIKNLEPMVFDAPADVNLRLSLLAQAYTYRGYSLYNLVQLYGEGTNGVPIPLTPNPGALPRSSVADVYTQIFLDLEHAFDLFEEGGKLSPRKNASQINQHVNSAISARAYLTRGQVTNDNALLAKAITKAELVTAAFPLSWGKAELDGFWDIGMWNKVNSEWVWGALLIDEQQTSYASFFSHMDPFFGGYCSLGNHHVMPTALYDQLDADDIRKIVNTPNGGDMAPYFGAFFGSKPRSSFKYTGLEEWTNDYLYIKSGEMYLIIAEAAARIGGAEEAKALTALNTLNENRYTGVTFTPSTATGAALLDEILLYRQAELWGDGQRFFDMKRLGIGNEGRLPEQLMREQTHTIPAGDARFNFLIPKQEMDSNPLMTQNEL